MSDDANPGDIYKIELETTGTLANGVYVLCYASDGSLLTRTGIIRSGESFSVAINTVYTVIVVYSQNTGGRSGTFTLVSLAKVS